MGVSFDYCLVVPDYLGAGEICAAANNNPVQITSRDCYYTNTPTMYSVDASLLSENIGGYNFEFGFWAGIEVTSTGVCLWLGNEDYEVCTKVCTTPDNIQNAEVLSELADDYVSEMEAKTGDPIWVIFGGIIAAVIVWALATIFAIIAGILGIGA